MFTPGPWVYVPDAPTYANAPYMVWTSEGPGHGTVAETNPTGLVPTDPERQAADARLIAAAPDLLSACKAARDYLIPAGVPAVLVAELIDLIARAEGRPGERAV